MNGSYDRRKFLKASILGLGAVFIHVPSPLAASHAVNETPLSDIDADLLYAQARDFFYRDMFPQATSLYQQLIAAFPDKYVYYDGYARLLGAQQKTLAAAELYREGLLKNPDNPYFMQRLALRLYDICMGNRKAETDFCHEHGETALFETSVTLMLQAIEQKNSNKGFYQNLQDILTGMERRNEQLTEKGLDPLSLSEEVQTEATTLLAQYHAAQAAQPVLLVAARTPVSRKKKVAIEERMQRMESRTRRKLYKRKDKLSFEENMLNARKRCLREGVNEAIEQNDIAQAEHYGTWLLDVDPHDTDTVGCLRKYYRREKDFNRIITLNRYLYMKEHSQTHALALAQSLARYANTTGDWEEAIRLAAPVGEVAGKINAVFATNYFITTALAYARLGRVEETENVLLKGLEQFAGRTSRTYILLEQYALITSLYTKQSIGEDILKTLTNNKDFAVDKNRRKDKAKPVWKHVDTYMEMLGGEQLSLPNRLKPLYALLKIQKKGSSDYQKTLAEIQKMTI